MRVNKVSYVVLLSSILPDSMSPKAVQAPHQILTLNHKVINCDL